MSEARNSPSTKPQGTELNNLQWLLGTWSRTNAKGTSFETWEKVADDLYRGFGTAQAQDSRQIRLLESLLLTQMSDDIFYIAKVAENPFPVSFKLTSWSETHAIFENLEHDFPQKLDYRLKAVNKLQVIVSGEADRTFTLLFDKQA